MGSLIAVFIAPILLLKMEMFEHYLFHSSYTPPFLILFVIFLFYIYPVNSKQWSRDRGDTGAIVGTTLGVLLGTCYTGPLPDDLNSGPFSLVFPSISMMSLCVVRFVVGLLLLLPTRFMMKLLCFKLLPAIMPTHGIQEVGKRPLVEMPYKLITYGAIGFNALYLCPVVFEVCGISRWNAL